MVQREPEVYTEFGQRKGVTYLHQSKEYPSDFAVGNNRE